MPASADQDQPAPAPEPETAPEPPRTPRQPRTSKAKGRAGKSPRLPFEEQLTNARELTASWSEQELTAEGIRGKVGCGQERSRQLRDALKKERAEGRSLHSVPAEPEAAAS